ncbi:MAG: phosphatidylinositol mannoside acyltransferase [Actinomycetes bacterium]
MSSRKDRFITLVFGAAWKLVRLLPEWMAYALFSFIADVLYSRQAKDVLRLQSNLRRVVGPEVSDADLRKLTRVAMHSYLRYWCEVFRLPSWTDDDIRSKMGVVGEPFLVEALAEGKGVVIVTPHMGNWDHAGVWVSTVHSVVTTVAERLEPEELFQKFLDVRLARGIDVIPLTGGVPPYPYLLNRIEQGRLIALVADRDLSRGAISVNFFGAEARFPPGPAALAVDTGAVLLPTAMYYEDGRNWVRFYPRIEVPADGRRLLQVREVTQKVADRFEEIIGEHPADWHMMQRVWVDDLDPTRVASE